MKTDLSSGFFRRLIVILPPCAATAKIAEWYSYAMQITEDLRIFIKNPNNNRTPYEWMKAAKGLIDIWRRRYWEPPSDLLETLQHNYDVRVVPYRAQHPGVLAALMHRVLRASGIVFVAVLPGMGHNTVELDYFMRLQRSGRISSKRYVLLRVAGHFHDDTVALYGRHFWFASNNSFLANLLAPVVARHKDLRLDVSTSRLRWHLQDDGTYQPPPSGQTFFYQITKAENRAAWLRYCDFRQETRTMPPPLKEGLTVGPTLAEFLGGNWERLALVHVKYQVVNATARPTDPATYVPAIGWLQDNGYKVVLIGREKMPAEFAALGVLDYANSPIACYRFDLELTAVAKVAITAGSGVAMMPDCMDVPLVYANSWHLGMPLASERCVIVPTLLMDRALDRMLTIAEQCALYWQAEDKGAEIFFTDRYEPRNASSDEILEAVKEALASESATVRQQAYSRIILGDDKASIGSRVSRYFIDRHASLLEEESQIQKRIGAR
jgi:putative glycosyltransferase (TIGR04372 family)